MEGWLRHALPSTYWHGDTVAARCFGELFATFKPRFVYRVAAVRLGSAFVLALLLRVRVKSVDDCRAVLTAAAVVFFVLAVFFAAFRPYRAPTDSVAAFALNLLAGLVSLSRAQRVMDRQVLLSVMVYTALGAAFVSMAVSALEFVVRRRIQAAMSAMRTPGTSAEAPAAADGR